MWGFCCGWFVSRVVRGGLGLAAGGLLVLVLVAAWSDLVGFRETFDFSLGELFSVALWAVALVLGLFAVMLLVAARAPRPASPVLPDVGAMARVDVFVPIRDEAPAILRRTLEAAARLVGARGALVVVDDSSEESAREANALLARAFGARHVTRSARVGYKAGALNEALRSSRAEFVAVLDVDHAPSPDFLRIGLAGFSDARVACVQTRIGWSNADAGIRRLAALLQHQFYGVIQWDRAARDRAVFAGSAAIFRRAALDDVGGFPEETLVEDFDLTVLLHTRQWRIKYDDRLGATGIMPWNGRDVARQLWRWSHGTTRVLRLRTGHILRAPIPLMHRLELVASASAYIAGGLFVLAGLLLAALAVMGKNIAPHAWGLPVVAPLAIFGAHTVTAAIAARRAGVPGGWIVIPYHLVTLAFTPVLFASTLAALASPRVLSEGRVTKTTVTGKTNAGLPTMAGLTAILGVVLAITAAVLSTRGGYAWVWALELGLAFTLPVLLWSNRKGYGSTPATR